MEGNQFSTSDVNEVRFPGLFEDVVFELKKQAFKIGSFTVYWYGIIISIGIIAAFIYFFNRGKKTEKIVEDDLLNITLFTIPIAVICARLLYVVTNLEDYKTFKSIIAINNGGLAIYGGIFGGMATILIYSKIKKIPVLKLFDAAAPAVMLGQLIGRWGNFVNCEAYGYLQNDKVLAKLPWRMEITSGDTGKVLLVHPTFLYESLWNLIGFVIINVIYKKKKFTGEIFALYIGWYGLGRAFIEMLRADSLRIAGQKMFVYIGFTCFIFAVVFFIYQSKKHRSIPDELDEYKRAYQISESEQITKSEENDTENSADEKVSDEPAEKELKEEKTTEKIDNSEDERDGDNT